MSESLIIASGAANTAFTAGVFGFTVLQFNSIEKQILSFGDDLKVVIEEKLGLVKENLSQAESKIESLDQKIDSAVSDAETKLEEKISDAKTELENMIEEIKEIISGIVGFGSSTMLTTVPRLGTHGDDNPIAIGFEAGSQHQGEKSVAVGTNAGQRNQGMGSVAIGGGAGSKDQSNDAISIGYLSGASGQGEKAIALGSGAGRTSQGENAICIGFEAGNVNQSEESICIGSRTNCEKKGGICIGKEATLLEMSGADISINVPHFGAEADMTAIVSHKIPIMINGERFFIHLSQ